MEKIIVKNSCIMITDYHKGECTKIENIFKIYDRISFKAYEFGSYYDEDNYILYLPRIDVWYLQRETGLAKSDVIIERTCDEYEYISGLELKVAPRDDFQKEALRFCTGNGEYKQNAGMPQLGLSLTTGKGKTYVSIATASYYEMKTIVITYSVGWLEQWKERIKDYTNLSDRDIYMISGSASINRILKSGKDDHKIYLVTHSTITTFANKYGWDKITQLFLNLKVGIKIIDEAHLNFVNVSMIDFFTNTFKTYYLTATPARSSEEENNIYGLYFKNVPSINLFDEEIDPHTKYIALKFNSHPSVYDIQECKNAYGLDRNRYIDYLTKRPVFDYILYVILDLAIKAGGKCLIYIGTNSAIKYTYHWINMHFPELSGDVGIFTTLVDKVQKEKEKDKRIILSTTKSAGAAMDIKGLKLTIVLDEPFKSHVLAQQSLGRTRDDNTYYIECVDMGFKQIIKYYNYKLPIFQKYALSCSEMPMRQEELEVRANIILNNIPKKSIISRSVIQHYDED